MRKKSALRYLTMVLALVIALGAPGLTAAESANLIKNPGFEQLANNFPTDWTATESLPSNDQAKIEVSTKAPHSGSYCLKIQNDAMRDSMAIQTLNVKKDTVYLLSCWIRTENILNEAGAANITLYYDNNGIDCKGIITSPELQNTNNQWTKLEFKFRTLKLSYPFYLGVRLGGQGTVNQGTAYFDDLTLQESDDSGQLLTFFIPGANSGSNAGTPGSNKVIIYVILGILAIGILVFLESKLGKKGKNNETEGESDDEEADEDEEVEESKDDEIQDGKGKEK
ncbi:MAG: carbohydrate binding domain-containing protein [Firmicutes bacterium]|nr:carbohydrate binding domain-containing protein [Bacillota bacterium]